MTNANILQTSEIKRKPPQRSGRKKAQDLIDAAKSLVREQFKNTHDSDVVSRYVGATRPSTQDVVIAGHEDRLDDHGARLAVIESRLGIRRESRAARLMLVRKIA